MRIGEFSAVSGLPVSTLRYYEREGLLPAPERRGGKRVYDPAGIALARMVRLARAAGFSIADLRVLTRFETSLERTNWLTERARQTEADIARLRRRRDWLAAAAECGCAPASSCKLLEAGLRHGD